MQQISKALYEMPSITLYNVLLAYSEKIKPNKFVKRNVNLFTFFCVLRGSKLTASKKSTEYSLDYTLMTVPPELPPLVFKSNPELSLAKMASWNKSGDGDDVELILRKLFVGGIKPDTSDDQFRNYFAKFGDIEVG